MMLINFGGLTSAEYPRHAGLTNEPFKAGIETGNSCIPEITNGFRKYSPHERECLLTVVHSARERGGGGGGGGTQRGELSRLPLVKCKNGIGLKCYAKLCKIGYIAPSVSLNQKP